MGDLLKFVFIIDCGYGIKTLRRNGNDIYEWEFNRSVGQRLYDMLKSFGIVHFSVSGVLLPFDETTESGIDENLQYRCRNANEIAKYYDNLYKEVKTIFISIHANQHTNPDVSGYGINIYENGGESEKIAKEIMKSAIDILKVGNKINNLGIKESNLDVLSKTSMPAVLIQHEYYTNIVGADRLKSDEFRGKCAKHIAQGVLNYCNDFSEEENFIPLKHKDKNDRVKELEEKLQKLGYMSNWVDTYFGTATFRAIKEFQKDYNLNITGIADEITYNKIIEIFNEKNEFSELKYEDIGIRVKELEENLVKLGYDLGKWKDNYYGTVTVKVIKHFQEENGLQVTGKVDKFTWQKLNEMLSKYEVEKYLGYITVIKINRKAISKCGIINYGNKLYTMSNMYDKLSEKPYFMINGGLFHGNHSLNLLFKDVKTLAVGVYSKYGLMMYEDGSFKMDWYKYTSGLKDMIGGSPAIIIDSKKQIDKGKMENALMLYKHPRSAIGLNEEFLFLITVDGRQKNMFGMNIEHLYKFVSKYKMTGLINLDGGGSVRLMRGKKTLNSPTENRAIHNSVGVWL